jgi:hypothetical protein
VTLGDLPLVSWLESGARFLLNRPRLRVRVFRDGDEPEGGLEFEIENTGGRPTSLLPRVDVTFSLISKGQLVRRRATYSMRDVDRALQPFTARRFSASAVERHPNYGFSWFRHYWFRTTTGQTAHAYVRHAMLEPLSGPRYIWERANWRLRGRLRGDMPSTIEEMDSQRRVIGPH